ncbi:MAG: hypothetical protein EOP06_09300 [Proteobacteria bacterium]|nr:MAG: hypothetical protein EOP06_09300 [Pseudomonadota bacterium]
MITPQEKDLYELPRFPQVKQEYVDLVHKIIREEQPRAPRRISRLQPLIVPLADMKYRGFNLKAMHQLAIRAGIDVGYSSFAHWAKRNLGSDSGEGSLAEAIVRRAVDDGAYTSLGEAFTAGV